MTHMARRFPVWIRPRAGSTCASSCSSWTPAPTRYGEHTSGCTGTSTARRGRRGVANMAGHTSGDRLAHTLKDTIAWDYQQSVTHLRSWRVV